MNANGAESGLSGQRHWVTAMASLAVAVAPHYSRSFGFICVHLRFLFLAVLPAAMASHAVPQASSRNCPGPP
jgi:hypothetical protein